MMISRIVALCSLLFLSTLLPQAALASKCPSSMLNPISDVSWQCIFPIRIGGLSIGKGDSGMPDPGTETPSPLCTCTTGAINRYGIGISMWEPARLIDTVSDPYCMMPLGFKLMNTGGKLGGAHMQEDWQSKTFQQMHYYFFPAFSILGLFYDIPCIAEREFDVAMMTELVPTWNNEILSLMIHPESLLFANPVAQMACAADSAGALVGRPVNSLFWCMGSWSGAYPLAGSITGTDYVTANAGIAARGIYFMARMGLLKESSSDGCYTAPVPIWSKDKYKLQLMKPVRDDSCRPIGQTGLLWSHYKHPPAGGDNFSWMVFRRLNCCVSY